MEIRHKIWLEKDGKVVFGQGRLILFKAIDECHSLNAAAKKLHMSYRAAWGRVRASESRLGIRLVEVDGTGRGMHLTAEGKRLVNRFDGLEQSIAAILAQADIS